MAKLAIAAACLACLCALGASLEPPAPCPTVCKTRPASAQQACRNLAVNEQMKKLAPKGAVGTTCASRPPQYQQQCINAWVLAQINKARPANAKLATCNQACVNAAIDKKQAQVAAECAKALAVATKASKDFDFDDDWDDDDDGWDNDDWDDDNWFDRSSACTPFNGPLCTSSSDTACFRAFMRRLGAQCSAADQACTNTYTLKLQRSLGNAGSINGLKCAAYSGVKQQKCLNLFVNELMKYARGKCVDRLGSTISNAFGKSVLSMGNVNWDDDLDDRFDDLDDRFDDDDDRFDDDDDDDDRK